jgi:hypothetical protein
VRYNPRKPSKFFVSVELDGFHVGQHGESLFADDIQPTVLNINRS